MFKFFDASTLWQCYISLRPVFKECVKKFVFALQFGNGSLSTLFDLFLGTIQRLVTEPYSLCKLCVTYVGSLVRFVVCWWLFHSKSKKFVGSVDNRHRKVILDAMTFWLRQSGLKVNQEKADCFLNQITPKWQWECSTAKSHPVSNKLEIKFDSKLCWAPKITYTIERANKALNAVKLNGK
jgi:hypothetical protein